MDDVSCEYNTQSYQSVQTKPLDEPTVVAVDTNTELDIERNESEIKD